MVGFISCRGVWELGKRQDLTPCPSRAPRMMMAASTGATCKVVIKEPWRGGGDT